MRSTIRCHLPMSRNDCEPINPIDDVTIMEQRIAPYRAHHDARHFYMSFSLHAAVILYFMERWHGVMRQYVKRNCPKRRFQE